MRTLTPYDPRAVAVLAVGDELLQGRVVDTNSAWVAGECFAAGLQVVAMRQVGDDAAAMVAALAHMSTLAGNIIITGGLGPTSDDITREVLAGWCGSELVEDARAVDQLIRWYRMRGRVPSPTALTMARVPRGAALLPNSVGSAPGVACIGPDGIRAFAVPGVPSEMRAMVADHVIPDLRSRIGGAPGFASIRVVGMGESLVAEAIADIEREILEDPDADIAYLAAPSEVQVRVRCFAGSRRAGQQRVDLWLDRARDILGDVVVGAGEESLEATVVELLIDRGLTVATAESLTGGGVARAMTKVPGASAALQGGVVAYSVGTKNRLLGVPAELLDRLGPVHADTAAAMARAIRWRADVDLGVATTGVAGPEAHGGHEPGTVFIAVCGPAAVDGGAPVVAVRQLALRGTREAIVRQTIVAALDLVRRVVLGLPVEPGS